MKLAAALCVASALAACGPQLWSFDDAVDASGDEPAPVPTGDGGHGHVVTSMDAATGCGQDCIPCVDDTYCQSSYGEQFCGVEQRCVECTGTRGCTSPNTSDVKFVCVDEHCVVSCASDDDCPAMQNGQHGRCSTGGYCLDCSATSTAPSTTPSPVASCVGFQQCSTAGICVDCTSDDACFGGTCSANGYCNRVTPRDY